MKKRVLSLSIRAMFADHQKCDAPASAYSLDEGAGHVLVVPYFEHQFLSASSYLAPLRSYFSIAPLHLD